MLIFTILVTMTLTMVMMMMAIMMAMMIMMMMIMTSGRVKFDRCVRSTAKKSRRRISIQLRLSF